MYGGSGVTLKMALSADAKVADWEPGADGRYTLNGDNGDKLYSSLAQLNPSLAKTAATDDGLSAALLGFDAVRVKDDDGSVREYVVLNRSALKVQQP
jgi:hypothetical protein